MKSTILLKICLGLGLTSYCLVILVSQDAPIFTLALMGTMALSLVLVSIGLMWREWINFEKDKPINQNSDNIYIK